MEETKEEERIERLKEIDKDIENKEAMLAIAKIMRLRLNIHYGDM